MASVVLSNLVKVYPNGFKAVQGADFSIDDGEFIVLVGPSGCGKSTLLRMIAGLEEISSGDLEINGHVVNDVDPSQRDIAMVFQNYALYPHMSVYKNMAYSLKNRNTPIAEIEQAVNAAAKVLGLEALLDRKPSQLSGGQRQRVAMGRAIVRNPALFLFDEPLSNLDAKLRGQMRIEIRRLQRELGVTAIYVTHDQVEAMTMADRIVVLNDGAIEQIGTPADIYHRPSSTFVAGFMGAPPMNLLRVKSQQAGVIQLDEQIQLSVPEAPGDKPALIWGIRPEDLRLSETGEIPFEVELVEELGAQRLLHGKLAAQDFSVIVPKGTEVSVGPVRLAPVPGASHLFDGDQGQRL